MLNPYKFFHSVNTRRFFTSNLLLLALLLMVLCSSALANMYTQEMYDQGGGGGGDGLIAFGLLGVAFFVWDAFKTKKNIFSTLAIAIALVVVLFIYPTLGMIIIALFGIVVLVVMFSAFTS